MITPCSFPAAMIDPENVTPPMITSSSVVTDVVADDRRSGLHVVVDADQCGGAAADRIEHADQLRHGGHLHGPGRVQAGRAADQRARDHHDPAGRVIRLPWMMIASVAAIAVIMPAVETWLPRRALAGLFIRCRPSTKPDAART